MDFILQKLFEGLGQLPQKGNVTGLHRFCLVKTQHCLSRKKLSTAVAQLACIMTTCSKNLMIRTRDCVVTSCTQLQQTLQIARCSCDIAASVCKHQRTCFRRRYLRRSQNCFFESPCQCGHRFRFDSMLPGGNLGHHLQIPQSCHRCADLCMCSASNSTQQHN